ICNTSVGGPMLGLKSFRNAAVVIGGIELGTEIKKVSSKWESSVEGPPGCRKSGEPHWLHNRNPSQIETRKPLEFRLIPNWPQNRAERHHAGDRLSARLPVPATRSGPEVLWGIRDDAGSGRGGVRTAPGAQPEFEGPRGALGAVDQS